MSGCGRRGSPTRRRCAPHGLGRMLLDACARPARRRGARMLGQRALASNLAAIRLYRRAGFVEEGRLVGEIRVAGHDVGDALMARWLT